MAQLAASYTARLTKREKQKFKNKNRVGTKSWAFSTNKSTEVHTEIQNADDINFRWFLKRTKSANIMQSFYASNNLSF